MKVKEVVMAAAVELGVADGVKKYLDGGVSETGEKDVGLLLTCFNLVENELALDYLPLIAEDELTSATGVVEYSVLANPVVRILSVEDEWENSVKFKLFPSYLKTQAGKVKITYTYTPSEKTIEDDSDYVTQVSVRLFSYGVAAEYLLAIGEFEQAAVWDRKYKEAIEAAYRMLPCKRIKSRRWV